MSVDAGAGGRQTAAIPPSGENVAQPESSRAADSASSAVLPPRAADWRRSWIGNFSVMALSYCPDFGDGVTRWFCSLQPEGAVGLILV